MIKIDYKNRFGKVAVLFGGNSGEREVSLCSGKAIIKALEDNNINVHPIDTKGKAVEQLIDGNFDRALIALHGKGGEDGVIQGVLESLDIPYTGSGVLGSAIGMDKHRSKQIWHDCGLSIIPSQTLSINQQLSKTQASQLLVKFGSKVVVKPSAEGSSLGISIVDNAESLITAIEQAAKFDGEVMIEQWINGPEYTVSLLNGKALPVIEIKPLREFYDYKAKYSASGTEYLCPTDLSKEQQQYLKDISIEAFGAINCSGWGRVDFIQHRSSEKFYILEVNTVPGMTETSLVPMAAKAAGLSFAELVIDILKTSESMTENLEEVVY